MNKYSIYLLGIIIPVISISGIIIYSDHVANNAINQELEELKYHHKNLERAIDVLNTLHTQMYNEKLDELLACQELLNNNQCK